MTENTLPTSKMVNERPIRAEAAEPCMSCRAQDGENERLRAELAKYQEMTARVDVYDENERLRAALEQIAQQGNNRGAAVQSMAHMARTALGFETEGKS